MNLTNILFSLSIAVLIPSILLGLLAVSPLMFVYVAMIGTFLSTFIALPAILILKKLNFFNIYTTLLSGFVIGAVPFSIWFFPKNRIDMKTNSYSSGFGETMIDGVTTNSGWAEYFVLLTVFGIIGLVFSLIFWITLTYVKNNEH